MYIYIKDNLDSLNEEAVKALMSKLPGWRREKAERFRYLAGRRECTLAYMLLMQGLQEQYGITTPPHFSIGPHGKPSLVEHPEIHFNLSHCKEAVLCALSNSAIGVDIERCRTYKKDLATYTMSPAEIQAIEQSDNPAMAFTRLWTAKEAVVKLLGTGIIDHLHNVLTEAEKQGIRIQTFESESGLYAYSIAVHK